MASRALPIDKLAAGLAFVLAFAAIAGAWGSQIFGGLVPCELCLGQRVAYYWGLPILLLVLIFWNRMPRTVWLIAMLIVGAIFVWGTYMGVYHAGVEWGFFKGPTECTGLGNGIDFGASLDFTGVQVIPCDAVQFRFLGISLAGYNALISAAVVVLIGVSIWFKYRGKRG